MVKYSGELTRTRAEKMNIQSTTIKHKDSSSMHLHISRMSAEKPEQL